MRDHPPNPEHASAPSQYPQYPGYPQYPQYPATAPAQHWSRYLDFLKRLWWVPLLTVLVAAGAAAAARLLQPPAYVSTASLWMSGKVRIPEGGAYNEELQFFLGTQVELLQSERLRERALERLQAQDPARPPSELALKIRQSPKTSVLLLEATGPNPEDPPRFLNALIDEYLAYKKEVRSASADNSVSSLSQQIAAQEKELRQAQEALSAFQQSNSLAVVQEQGNAFASYLAKLNAQLSDLNLQYQVLVLAEGSALTNGAPAADTAPANPASTNTVEVTPDPRRLADANLPNASPSPEFLAARQQVQILRMQRDELGRFLRPAHPKMQRLEEDIARAEKMADLYRQQSADQIDSTKQALQMKIKGLEASIQEWQAKLTGANALLTEFERRKAEVQRLQGVYDRLLNLLQTLDLGKNLDQEMMAVMERAGAAKLTRMVTPARMALAIAAGLFFGLGLVFIVSRLDDRITSMDEVTLQFPEEIVGQVPEVGRGSRRNGHLQLLGRDDPRHTFAESYRNIRSSVIYMGVNGAHPRSLLVTSALPNEGKSTVSANLARSMAFAGSKVLLVDADLRRGRVHEQFGVPRGPGLSEMLRYKGQPREYIVPTDLPTLFVITSGETTNASTELFLASHFNDTLRELTSAYDYVIIDSPPVFAADDATTLAPKTDGVLFVVRGRFTGARAAQRALDLLYQRQARVLGLVFNRANARAGSYYYYKYSEYYHSDRSRTPADQTAAGGRG